MSVHSLKREAKPAPLSLDQLLADPSRAQELSPSIRAALIVTLAAPSLVPVPDDAPASDHLLTASELADQLHVKESWVGDQARRGLIPKTMVGRYPRFDLLAVRSALAKRRKA